MAETITITPVGGATTTLDPFKRDWGVTEAPPAMGNGDKYWIGSPRYGSMLRSENDMRRSYGDPVKIDLGEAGRLIQFRILFWGTDEDTAMTDYITLADTWRGTFSTIVVFDKSFSNCSFMGDDVPGAEWLPGGDAGEIGYAITLSFQQVQS